MDELSFEELGKAFAKAMRGEALDETSENSDAPATLSMDDFVDIPDELNDDYEGAFESDDADGDLGLFDENEDEFAYVASQTAGEFDDDGVVPVSPLSVLEAMLFVGNPQNLPLRPQTAAELMRGVKEDEVRDLAAQLQQRYDEENCPWTVVYDEDADGYSLQLRDRLAPLREVFYGKIRQAKLSQSAVDVLAIIAYEQPLTLDEINKLRGTNCAAILNQLVRRKLLRVQKARRGTKFITEYYTTDRFLKLYELEALADLPQSQNLDRE